MGNFFNHLITLTNPTPPSVDKVAEDEMSVDQMVRRHVQIFLKTPTSKDLSLKFYRHLGNLNRSNLQQEKFDKFLKSYFFKKRNRPKIVFFSKFQVALGPIL
jgi:hypothetical protein